MQERVKGTLPIMTPPGPPAPQPLPELTLENYLNDKAGLASKACALTEDARAYFEKALIRRALGMRED